MIDKLLNIYLMLQLYMYISPIFMNMFCHDKTVMIYLLKMGVTILYVLTLSSLFIIYHKQESMPVYAS